MTFDLELSDGIGLRLSSGPLAVNGYPTERIQKGWLLSCDGHDLSEEAVGFGVPVIKRGLQTIFPGEVKLSIDESDRPLRFHANYHLCLEEKISQEGTKQGTRTIDNQLVYNTKNLLAGMIRGLPALRRTLTATSSMLREKLGWRTIYEKSDFSAQLSLSYTILPTENKLVVEVGDLEYPMDRVSEIIIMNEQGAHHFDEYQDSRGSKRGNQIGCWDEVAGPNASFISKTSRLSFSLPRVDGVQLYHGRELIGSRLAWAGFGYSFPPAKHGFRYEVALRRLE